MATQLTPSVALARATSPLGEELERQLLPQGGAPREAR